MIIALSLLLLLVCALVFLEDYMGEGKWYPYIIIGIIMILLAALKEVGNDGDSQSYEIMFHDYDDPIMQLTVEPSYIFFSRILNYFTDDVHSIFLLYALIAIPLKMRGISKMSNYIYLSLALYLSHTFILHDLIQIRASVAAAFFITSIKPLCEGKKAKAFGLMGCAIFFHYSALALVPLLLFGNNELTRRWKIGLGLVVPLGYILYFMHIDPLTTIPLPYISNKIETYKALKEIGGYDEIFVFKNPILLIKITAFYLLLFYYDTVKTFNKYLPMLLKIMAVSMGCFFFFSALPVLSGRLYELFGAIDIITIPLIAYVFKPKWAGKLIVVIAAVIMFGTDILLYKLIS